MLIETGLTTAIGLSNKDSISDRLFGDAWGPFLPQQKLQSPSVGPDLTSPRSPSRAARLQITSLRGIWHPTLQGRRQAPPALTPETDEGPFPGFLPSLPLK